MRKKQQNDQSKTGLPVPATAADALPVLTEHGQLELDLRALERGVNGCRMYGMHMDPAAKTVSCIKAALPIIDQLRAGFRALDRPATIDQIATEMLRLATTMPNAGNIDQGMLADSFCEDIAELRPTFWALARGCRAHRGKSEFLSLAKLEEEIRRAELHAARYRELLRRDLAADLKSAEERLQDDLREHAAWERREKFIEKMHAERERARRGGPREGTFSRTVAARLKGDPNDAPTT